MDYGSSTADEPAGAGLGFSLRPFSQNHPRSIDRIRIAQQSLFTQLHIAISNYDRINQSKKRVCFPDLVIVDTPRLPAQLHHSQRWHTDSSIKALQLVRLTISTQSARGRRLSIRLKMSAELLMLLPIDDRV